jgi:ribose 5-phosphate isomerase B
VIVGSDHRGVAVKRAVVEALSGLGVHVDDVGTHDEEAVDYPDYAGEVARAVASGRAARGVLVCGSGIGMSIAANKVSGVRAALVQDAESARMSRLHNDANVLVLGASKVPTEAVAAIVQTWMATDFEGGRHEKRVAKISRLEKGE